MFKPIPHAKSTKNSGQVTHPCTEAPDWIKNLVKACHKILILSMLYFQLLYIEFNKLAGLRKQSTLKNQYGTKNNVFRSCDRRCSLS